MSNNLQGLKRLGLRPLFVTDVFFHNENETTIDYVDWFCFQYRYGIKFFFYFFINEIFRKSSKSL